MRKQTWWCLTAGLVGAVLLAASIAAPPVLAWGGEPLPLAVPALNADGSRSVAAIPRPPDPPPLPTALTPELSLTQPETPPAPESPGEPAPETPLVLDHPVFDDPRTDVVVVLPPGIPVPSYPVVINAQVEALMDYFTARERERFGMWIARSGRYLGMIERVFRERGLPEELAYTAMIESGFSPRAVSRVGAKGLWQFMEATARRYGLVVNRWVDERLDPVKATIAAAKYLGDLYGMFGHWFLAQAAYNAGEARVARAIQRAKTSDFWALTQTRHLPTETKRFVPQILAATVITRAPGRYGFEAPKASPLEYDEVSVKRALDFETIASFADVSVEDVRELNPALRGGVTPPFGTYALRLPVGSAERFQASLDEAGPSRVAAWTVHRVGRNQSLAEIARLYRTTPQRLADVNQLMGGRLRGVTELLVPANKPAAPAVAAVFSRPPARKGAVAKIRASLRVAARDEAAKDRPR